MATLPAQLIPIKTVPGVQPDTDWTPLATPHYTMSDKIRFWRGIPQKIGGWNNLPFLNGATIKGKTRSIYSAVINNVATTIIGTNSYLYALFGQTLTNITPLDTAVTVITNSISTDYTTLGSNPIATTNGSGIIVVSDTNAANYQVNDDYTLSGATTTNGITNTFINTTHAIRAIGINTVTIATGGTATSSGSGGGASVVRSTGLLTFAATAHGQANGDRTKITLAAQESAASAVVSVAGTGYTPADILTEVGGTASVTATFSVATTKVVSATVAAGGSGGTNGTQTVTGTTGTGTKFQASVTVSGGAITAVLSISVAGSYTVNPTIITAEPVTGASLSGATLNVVMGASTVTVGTAGVYSAVPSNPVSTTSSPGAGCTLTVTYSGSNSVAGIPNSDINIEFIIRDVSTNAFSVMTSGTATSAVTTAGGALTSYQKQIAAGYADESLGVGYGLGLYGVGLYGTSKMSVSGLTYPRIWYFDRFGDRVVMTPGNQSKIYLWDGNISVAPTILTNAPTAVNFLFVSNNILMTYGYQNVSNQLFGSDSGNATIWSASSANQVFQDVIAGAEALVSSVPVLGVNLLFTNSQTYILSYIGLPLIWSISLLDNSNGIIAPMARCSVNGVAYWMGNNNFYMWSGGNVQQIPSNSMSQCTLLKYVFGNLNYAQAAKCFAWYNDIFNEIWFHYPSASSNECDRVARLSISDLTWSPDTFDRTAAEYPQNLFNNPRMISSANNLYVHEQGTDADGSPMPFMLTTNLRTSGKETCLITGFVPDSVQTGDINVNIVGMLFPQSSDTTFNENYIIASSGTGQDPRENIQLGARFWQYTWSGNSLGQNWIMGNWNELIQKSAPN